MKPALLIVLLLAAAPALGDDPRWYGAIADAEKAWSEDRWVAAEAAWRRAISYEAFAEGDPEGFARTLGKLGTVCARQGKHADAKQFFTRALPLVEAEYGVAHPDVVVLWIDIAASDRELGNLDAAEREANRAIEMASSSRVGPVTHARALNTLGNIRAEQDRDDDALELYRIGARLLEAELGSDAEELGVLLIAIAETELALDRPEKAEAALVRALPIAKSNPISYDLDEGQIQLLLGDAFERQRFYTDAKQAYAAAADLHALRGAAGSAFEAERRLGALHLARGEHEPAVAVLKRAVDRAGSGAPSARAAAWVDLARAHEETGKPDAAIPCYERAVEILDAMPDAGANLAVPLGSLGRLHRAKKDPEAAAQYYGRALDVLRRHGRPDDPDVGALEFNLGAIAYEARDDATARAHFESALGVWKSSLPADDPRLDRVRGMLDKVGGELPAVAAPARRTDR